MEQSEREQQVYSTRPGLLNHIGCTDAPRPLRKHSDFHFRFPCVDREDDCVPDGSLPGAVLVVVSLTSLLCWFSLLRKFWSK